MGIDKCIPEGSPIAVIDGHVYQCGKCPAVIPWTDIPWDPPQWKAESHDYAKDYFCFASEAEMLAFVEARGLKVAAREGEAEHDRLFREARERILAVLDRELMPDRDWVVCGSDPDIGRQVSLIVDDAVRRCRLLPGWEEFMGDDEAF